MKRPFENSIFLYTLFFFFVFIVISPAHAQKRLKKVLVSNTKDFLKAIGPNTEVVLDSATYDLSKVSKISTSYVSWNKSSRDNPQPGLMIYNVMNLKITSSRGARIITDFVDAPVIEFNNCYDITLKNVFLGYTYVSKGKNAVVKILDSKRITLDKCKISGEGTLGIFIKNCDSINITNSTLTKCSIGLMSSFNSSKITFFNTTFEKSGSQPCFNVNSTNILRVNQCKFNKNYVASYSKFFFVFDNTCKEILINGNEFLNNESLYLIQQPQPDVVKLGENIFKGNTFKDYNE